MHIAHAIRYYNYYNRSTSVSVTSGVFPSVQCRLRLTMPVPLSTDLRWRIVWLHHYKEYSNQDIADLLYIHVTTVRRIITHYDTYGDVAPVSYKHGPNRMLGQQDEDAIIELATYG